jgi:hypothetical protein
MYLSKENHLCLKLPLIAHCIPVRINIAVEMNPSATWMFQGGDRLFLLQIGLLSEVEETHLSL